MRSLHTVLAIAGATVVALLGDLAAQGAQTGNLEFTVVERALSDKTVDIGARGDSIGDLLVFANPLYDAANARQIGTDNGSCTRTVVGKAWECAWTNVLADGQLMVTGTFQDTGEFRLRSDWRNRPLCRISRPDEFALPRSQRHGVRFQVLHQQIEIRLGPAANGALSGTNTGLLAIVSAEASQILASGRAPAPPSISWQGAPKTKEHAMAETTHKAVAVVGIDIGKNSIIVLDAVTSAWRIARSMKAMPEVCRRLKRCITSVP